MKKLINALQTLDRFQKGEVKLKTTEVIPPKVNVRQMRATLGLSQTQFATKYGFSVGSVRNWEQGAREPEGPARLLLGMIQQDPALIEQQLKRLHQAA